MPRLMNIGDETTIVFNMNDFIELVEHYMGYDARSYIEEQLEEVERLEDEIKEYRSDNERIAEAHNLILYNIFIELGGIAKMIGEPRMDKKKVLKSINDLIEFIDRVR